MKGAFQFFAAKIDKNDFFMTENDITSDVCEEFNLLKAKIKGNIYKIYDLNLWLIKYRVNSFPLDTSVHVLHNSSTKKLNRFL